MKSKIIALSVLIISLSVIMAYSYNVFADDVSWRYDSQTKTLYISGYGEMADYLDEYSKPWYSQLLHCEHIIIEDGITYVGDNSFSGAGDLVSVELPSSLTAIGAECFASCPNLMSIDIPQGVISIGDSSFAYDGVSKKQGFVVFCSSGSYALSYAYNNSITFSADSIKVGAYDVEISVKRMKAIYPYEVKSSGEYKIYSTGNYDTIGYVYDSQLKQVAYNDDADSNNTNFVITVNLEKGSTYYFITNIYSSGMTGNYTINLEPVAYNLEGTLFAAKDISGTPSNIPLTNVTINGSDYSNDFSILLDKDDQLIVEYNNMKKTIIPNPDEDMCITFVACDLNYDGYINIKDYYLMRKSNSPYMPLFYDLWNCKVK